MPRFILGLQVLPPRIEYDLHYIRHMDAALDLMIVWHSFFPGTERHRHV